MSQYFQSAESAPSPPDVPTTFVSDDGNAIPAVNTLNVLARDTSVNDLDGIRTNADPNGSAFLYVEITNRLQGTATSTLGSNADLITFDLGLSAAVYRFEFKICGRDTTTGDAVGYTLFSTVKTNGVAATVIATPFIDADEDASLLTSNIDCIASGNNIILRFTGTVTQTINVSAVGYYVVV